MLILWCGLAVLLAVVYMVIYTLLRTSADGRPWWVRLRHPNGGSAGPDDAQGRRGDGR